jgi:membrane associated rhomboid family serine protease
MSNLCNNCGFLLKQGAFNCSKCKFVIESKSANEPPINSWVKEFGKEAKVSNKNKGPAKFSPAVIGYNLLVLSVVSATGAFFYFFRDFLSKFPAPANTFLLVSLVLAMIYFSNHPQDIEVFIGSPREVKEKREYYRFLTSGFMHVNFIHILFNGLALYSFGGGAESLLRRYYPEYGSLIYLFIFLVGLILADLPTYFKENNNTQYRALGASGAVSLVLGLYLTHYPNTMVLVFFIPMKGWVFLFAFLAISLFLSVKANKKADRLLSLGGSNPIGHLTHFTGAIIGVVIAFWLMLFG